MIPNTNFLHYKKLLNTTKTISFKSDIPSKDVQKKDTGENSNKLILYGLSSLAVAGMAILLISNAKRKIKNVTKSAGNDMQADFSYMEKIKKFISNNFDKTLFETKAKDIKLKLTAIDDFSQTKEELDILSQVSAIKITCKQKNAVNFPDVININGTNQNNAKYISNILSFVLGCDFKYRKYSGRNLGNFVKMLSDKSSSNDVKPTFMFIENYEQMIKDLNKSENSSLLKQYQTILQNNTGRQISYLVSSEIQPDKSNSLLLKFTPELKEEYLTSELRLLDPIYKLLKNKYTPFQKRTSKYVNRGDSYLTYESLVTDKISVLFVEDGNEKYVHDFVNEIIDVTGGRYEKFDCKDKSADKIAEQLKSILEMKDEDYNLTAKKTYLYLPNLENIMKNLDKESSEYKKITDLLKNADDNFHTTAIISSDIDEHFVDAENCKLVSFLTEAKNIEEGNVDLICTGNIAEQQNNLQKFFINPLLAEQQGQTSEIDDGILIYGPSSYKDNFINWLRHAAPVEYKEMQFNEKEPIVSLEELIKLAKRGQKAFEITGKRTLLNVKDIDKFLSNFDTPEKRGNIGNFKAFAEVLSSDYHTTIITKTDLNPEKFESAAFERFGIPVELKDKIN